MSEFIFIFCTFIKHFINLFTELEADAGFTGIRSGEDIASTSKKLQVLLDDLKSVDRLSHLMIDKPNEDSINVSEAPADCNETEQSTPSSGNQQ